MDGVSEFLERENSELSSLGLEDLSVKEDSNIEDSVNNSNEDYKSISKSEIKGEPESIKQWRLEREKFLNEAKEKEKEAIELLKKKASNDLKAFDDNRNRTIKANHEKCLQQVESRKTEQTKNDIWEGAVKICNFNNKNMVFTKDVTRIKSILLRAKQNPPIRA